MTHPEPRWRAMAVSDLPVVAALEMLCHASLPPEGEALFAERLALFPAGCLAVADQAGLCGYVVSHAWRIGDPPHLGHGLRTLPDNPDCLHLHDLALAPRARGRGLVRKAVALLGAVAASHRLGRISLVAVHGSAALWASHGFARTDRTVSGYGESVYMVREA